MKVTKKRVFQVGVANTLVLLMIVMVGFWGTGCEKKESSGTAQTATASKTSAAKGGAAAWTPLDTSPAAIARGKDLFESSCSACHGEDGKGLPNLGKDLVNSSFAKGLSDKELVAFITKGRDTNDPLNTTHVPMPPKGGNPALTVAKIRDIVAYNRTLEKGD